MSSFEFVKDMGVHFELWVEVTIFLIINSAFKIKVCQPLRGSRKPIIFRYVLMGEKFLVPYSFIGSLIIERRKFPISTAERERMREG